MTDTEDGCPACSWDGQVSVSHDYDHEYYTHTVEKDGELLTGRTCSRRTRERTGPLARLWRLVS